MELIRRNKRKARYKCKGSKTRKAFICVYLRSSVDFKAFKICTHKKAAHRAAFK